MIRIHKEGYPTIFWSACALIFLNFLLHIFLEKSLFKDLFVIISFLFVFGLAYFFRHPKRNILKYPDNIVVSPADGKVVQVKQVEEDEYFKDKRIQISIFLSVLNVHANCHPFGGEIIYSKYHPGKYLVAFHPKSSLQNERTTVVVENEKTGKVLFRQIAGILARRIVNYAKVGTKVKHGDEQGFIKFGSRMDVFLPLGTEIKVAKGNRVKGGLTTIAKI